MKAGANSCRAGRPGSPTRMQEAGPPALPAAPSAPRQAAGMGKWQGPTWERGDAEVLGAPGSRSVQSPALGKTHATRSPARAVPGPQPPQNAAGYLLRSPTPRPLLPPPHPPPSRGRRRNLRWSSDQPWRSCVSSRRCRRLCPRPLQSKRAWAGVWACECERVKVRLWVHEEVWESVQVWARGERQCRCGCACVSVSASASGVRSVPSSSAAGAGGASQVPAERGRRRSGGSRSERANYKPGRGVSGTWGPAPLAAWPEDPGKDRRRKPWGYRAEPAETAGSAPDRLSRPLPGPRACGPEPGESPRVCARTSVCGA